MDSTTSAIAFGSDELYQKLLDQLVDLAFLEDFGSTVSPRDLTSEATIAEGLNCRAEILLKESAVVAGLPFVEKVMKKLNKNIEVQALVKEGTYIEVAEPKVVAIIEGRARDLLKGERLALNLMQRICGVATQTRRYTQITAASGITILDTRKTSPAMRVVERYAVRAAGGTNHRFGLFDAILIKDNHLKAAGGVRAALRACKEFLEAEKPTLSQAVEVEVSDIQELQEALEEGAPRILLDNMPPDMVRAAIAKIRASGADCFVEVSGGVNLDNLKSYLIDGVNAISTGALTHSARNIDLSLEFTLQA